MTHDGYGKTVLLPNTPVVLFRPTCGGWQADRCGRDPEGVTADVRNLSPMHADRIGPDGKDALKHRDGKGDARAQRVLLLLAGDDAFRMANTYYASVRAAARSNLPEAVQVFQLLQQFWHRRKTSSSEEPTEQ